MKFILELELIDFCSYLCITLAVREFYNDNDDDDLVSAYSSDIKEESELKIFIYTL